MATEIEELQAACNAFILIRSLMGLRGFQEIEDGSGPRNEMGEPCVWPYDPILMTGQPLGQYHCGWCGAMVVAGMPHPDYGSEPLCPSCGKGPMAEDCTDLFHFEDAPRPT